MKLINKIIKMKMIITGPPRCGKSTLISKLIDYYRKKNYTIYGFLTPEVRIRGTRIGFDIEDIYSGGKAILARTGNYQTQYKVGKYKVFIKEFELMLSNLKINLEEEKALVFIDEIGKMELYSKKFQTLLKNLFTSKLSIISTIGLKLTHYIKDYIINLPDVRLFHLSRQNFNKKYEEIINLMS